MKMTPNLARGKLWEISTDLHDLLADLDEVHGHAWEEDHDMYEALHSSREELESATLTIHNYLVGEKP